MDRLGLAVPHLGHKNNRTQFELRNVAVREQLLTLAPAPAPALTLTRTLTQSLTLTLYLG